MTKRALWAIGLMSVGTALVSASGASAATSSNMCQLTATATFSTPLSMNPGPFAYAVRGRLDGCKATSDIATPPAGATVEAGQIYTAPDGKRYREPGLTGTGNCIPGNLSQWQGGTLIVRWDGGGITLLPTGGAGQGPVLQFNGGASAASIMLQPVDPRDDPLVLQTTLFAGYSSIGAAFAQYDSPADCSGTGVKSATISGAFGPYHF